MTLKTFYQLDNEVQNIRFKSDNFDEFTEKHEFSIPMVQHTATKGRRWADYALSQFEIKTDRSFDELEQEKERQNYKQIARFFAYFQSLGSKFESVSATVDSTHSYSDVDDLLDNAAEVCEAEVVELPYVEQESSLTGGSPYDQGEVNMYDLLNAETRCPHQQWHMKEFLARLKTGDIFMQCEFCGKCYVPSVIE